MLDAENLKKASDILKANGVVEDEANGVLVAVCKCLGLADFFEDEQYDVLFE